MTGLNKRERMQKNQKLWDDILELADSSCVKRDNNLITSPIEYIV